MTLLVKCKYCGFEHPSAIQIEMSFEALKTSELLNNSEDCPKCGKMSTYSGKDYYYS